MDTKWETAYCKSGQILFYYNAMTGEIQWPKMLDKYNKNFLCSSRVSVETQTDLCLLNVDDVFTNQGNSSEYGMVKALPHCQERFLHANYEIQETLESSAMVTESTNRENAKMQRNENAVEPTYGNTKGRFTSPRFEMQTKEINPRLLSYGKLHERRVGETTDHVEISCFPSLVPGVLLGLPVVADVTSPETLALPSPSCPHGQPQESRTERQELGCCFPCDKGQVTGFKTYSEGVLGPMRIIGDKPHRIGYANEGLDNQARRNALPQTDGVAIFQSLSKIIDKLPTAEDSMKKHICNQETRFFVPLREPIKSLENDCRMPFGKELDQHLLTNATYDIVETHTNQNNLHKKESRVSPFAPKERHIVVTATDFSEEVGIPPPLKDNKDGQLKETVNYSDQLSFSNNEGIDCKMTQTGLRPLAGHNKKAISSDNIFVASDAYVWERPQDDRPFTAVRMENNLQRNRLDDNQVIVRKEAKIELMGPCENPVEIRSEFVKETNMVDAENSQQMMLDDCHSELDDSTAIEHGEATAERLPCDNHVEICEFVKETCTVRNSEHILDACQSEFDSNHGIEREDATAERIPCGNPVKIGEVETNTDITNIQIIDGGQTEFKKRKGVVKMENMEDSENLSSQQKTAGSQSINCPSTDLPTNTCDIQPFECEQCLRRFRYAWNLKIHKRTHTGEKPYECEQCGKQFRHSGTLKSHFRIHSNEKPFECNQCGKQFRTYSDTQRHARVHTNVKPFACKQCGKRFSRSYTLTIHAKTHSDERPYECTQCGKRFRQSCNLTTHAKTHSDERPYECTQCGKRFRESMDLKRHLKTHTDVRPFECAECGKRFKGASGLKHHSSTHDEHRPYFQCTECGKRYKGSLYLKHHMETHRPVANVEVGDGAAPPLENC